MANDDAGTPGILPAASLQALFGYDTPVAPTVNRGTSATSVNLIDIPDPRALGGKIIGKAAGIVLDPVKNAIWTGIVWAGAMGLGVTLILIGAWRTTKGGE